MASRKQVADAIRQVISIYREAGVTGTIGTADVVRMLRSQGRLTEADELEQWLAVARARGNHGERPPAS
jgi:exo-beta-1,3-glucanase (GH17 family)